MPICRMLLAHLTRLAASLALASTGSSSATRSVMMEMTTSSSMSVKPRVRGRRGDSPGWWSMMSLPIERAVVALQVHATAREQQRKAGGGESRGRGLGNGDDFAREAEVHVAGDEGARIARRAAGLPVRARAEDRRGQRGAAPTGG